MLGRTAPHRSVLFRPPQGFLLCYRNGLLVDAYRGDGLGRQETAAVRICAIFIFNADLHRRIVRFPVAALPAVCLGLHRSTVLEQQRDGRPLQTIGRIVVGCGRGLRTGQLDAERRNRQLVKLQP